MFNNKAAVELLYTHQFYALHDLLEDYWKHQKEGPEKIKIQALLQLVVSMHHKQNNNHKGFEILYAKASTKLGLVKELSISEIHRFLEKELEII